MSSSGAPPRAGWIARTIAVSATHPWLTVMLVAALGVWGWYAIARSPLDAIPDLSDVQVIVFTEWPGQSPDIIEDQVTYALAAAPPVDVRDVVSLRHLRRRHRPLLGALAGARVPRRSRSRRPTRG